MNSDGHLTGRRSLVAELVLAQGQVEPQPVNKAFEELAIAVRQTRAIRPFGAVITSIDLNPGPDAVWRSYLNAKDRFDDAFAHVVSTGAEMVELIKGPRSVPGFRLVSSSMDDDPAKSVVDY